MRVTCEPRQFAGLLLVARVVQRHDLRVVDIAAERALDGLDVDAKTVRSELDAAGEPGPEIVHHVDCRLRRATAESSGHSQTGVRPTPGPA